MNLTEDRQLVRSRLDINWVVEAGAGTGKTTLLIERLCFTLLAQGILAPRLVALTFTEKAAAEIKTRLMSKLQAVINAVRKGEKDAVVEWLHDYFSVPNDDIVARAELALTQLDRSQIGTIHSFCADILRSFPLEAGLAPQAEIDTGSRGQHILETEWNRFLDVELGAQSAHAAQWKEVLSRISLSQLFSWVQEMCSGKIEQYDYFAQKDKLIAVCQERAIQTNRLSTAFLEKGKKPRAVENALQQAQRRFEQAVAWLQSGQLPAAEEETIPIGSSVPKGWDASSIEEAKALCRFAEQADPCVQSWILKVHRLLEGLISRVKQRYEAEGILSFDDLIVKTRNLLKTNLLVRRLLQEKYDAFYIDEFQDTDPVQGEILLFLAEQKGRGATSWQQVQLQPGKLCVVGDPKQSIYRFRGADITAYELFTDLILKQGGQKAYLRQNFRSEPDIIALTNQVCCTVMKEKPAFQPAYEPIFTAKPFRQPAVEITVIQEGEGQADDYRHNQAQWVARWIEQHVGTDVLANGQKLAYKDIAILSRAGTTLGPYTEALRRHGIPFLVEEDPDFYTRQEIADLLNLLRVLEDPQDKIALAGVMRSPLGALTDEELYQAAQRKELDFRVPSESAKLERLFAQLRYLSAQKGRMPLYQFLQWIVQETGLREICAYAYEGANSIEHIMRLVSLAQGYALQNPVSLGQFLARVDDLITQELNRLTSASGEAASQAVNVMSIHKSKGLEFPVVIWVDLSKQEKHTAATQDTHLYSWRYNIHGLRVGKYADLNLVWLEEEQREHSRCEEVRVLYVALTRAREKLVLVGNDFGEAGTVMGALKQAGIRPENTEIKIPIQWNSVPYVSPENFIYQHQVAESARVALGDLEKWKEAYSKRQAAYEQNKQNTKSLSPSKRAEHEDVSDVQAMRLGSLVHAVLQRFGQYPQETPQQLLQAALSTTGQDLYEQALVVLNSFWQSEAFEQLRQLTPLGTELPFSLDTEQGVMSGIVDFLGQDKSGTVWVLDYKTDEVTHGQEPAAAQKYWPQLEVYMQAARRLYPQKTVKGAIVFIRGGIWVEYQGK